MHHSLRFYTEKERGFFMPRSFRRECVEVLFFFERQMQSRIDIFPVFENLKMQMRAVFILVAVGFRDRSNHVTARYRVPDL